MPFFFETGTGVIGRGRSRRLCRLQRSNQFRRTTVLCLSSSSHVSMRLTDSFCSICQWQVRCETPYLFHRRRPPPPYSPPGNGAQSFQVSARPDGRSKGIILFSVPLFELREVQHEVIRDRCVASSTASFRAHFNTGITRNNC